MCDISRLDIIWNALYKSGREIVYFSDVDEIVSLYSTGFELPVTKSEFLTVVKEFCDKSWHLVVGGRKSENPYFVLYGNIYKSRNKDR